MESISNENEITEVSEENDDIEQDSPVEKSRDLETEVTEEVNTEDDKLETDVNNLDNTNNDDENKAGSETNRSETEVEQTHVDDLPTDVEVTEEENIVADGAVNEPAKEEETANVDDDNQISETVNDTLAAEDVVEDNNTEIQEVVFETSQDLVSSLLDDIIETVFSGLVGVIDGEEEKDSERKDKNEFERIEEVNEPEEQPDEALVLEEDTERSVMINLEETIIVEDEGGEEKEGEEEEEEEDSIELAEEPTLTREELILQLKNAESEKIALFERNTAFQHKLGEYLRRKKVDQPALAISDTKDLTDFDQKYAKLMESLKELMDKYEIDSEAMKDEIEELKSQTLLNEDHVKQEKENFKNYRFAIAQKSVNTRTGKSISQKEMEDLNGAEEKMENVVVDIRLESIKLQNEVTKSENILKSKEELADGLHLIDFEQFKIENQSYNEKLEERTEDLLKLRKKITSNVHVLTHVKEKLEFVKSESEIEGKVLQEIDEKLNRSRDHLTGLKQARDKLRISNDKMKRSSGMLGNRDLLRNYEDCVDTVEIQVEKMNGMKNKQLQLSLRNQALQMKIENTRKGSSTQ